MDKMQQAHFQQAIQQLKAKTQTRAVSEKKETVKGAEGFLPTSPFAGSIHDGFDPTTVDTGMLTEVPVIIMNARSQRKLFAQAGKRPAIFETWAKGFGAGPAEHTFKDNKWWLVPQKGGDQYVVVNSHVRFRIPDP